MPLLLNAQLAGPILFDVSEDYDNYFKEGALYHGIEHDSQGYISLRGQRLGISIYDSSTTGGSNGNGGTGGEDFDNHFEDIAVSAWIGCSNYYTAIFRGGYLMRLDENENNGYLVQVTSGIDMQTVIFEIHEGAGVTQSGSRIFYKPVALDSITLETDKLYSFKVSLVGGTFTMDFANGEASASYTDTSVSADIGQIGILLAPANDTVQINLDDFTIINPAESHPPYDILLSGSSVEENDWRITEVGTLSSRDPDSSSVDFTYSLVSGSGDSGNAFFTISGPTLLTAKSFNFEAASEQTLRVQTTDETGNSYEEIITISIQDMPESPHRISDFHQVAENHYYIKWPVHAGYSYQLKQSRDLSAGSWENRGAPEFASDGASSTWMNVYTDAEETTLFFKVDRTELE